MWIYISKKFQLKNKDGLLVGEKSYYFYKKECVLDYILVDTDLFVRLHETVARATLTSFFPGISAIAEPPWFR